MSARQLLTARQVQAITGLGRTKAYELMHDLGCIHIAGRNARVSRDRLEAYMRETRQEAPSTAAAAVLAASLMSLPGIAAPDSAGVYAIQGAGGFIKPDHELVEHLARAREATP